MLSKANLDMTDALRTVAGPVPALVTVRNIATRNSHTHMESSWIIIGIIETQTAELPRRSFSSTRRAAADNSRKR